MSGERILVIGYGNPGRADDGLGPALAERLEALGLPGVTVESDYQLSIEHAAMAAEHDIVVFADADGSAGEPFYLRPVEGRASGRFTTHGVDPCEVLHLARACFGAAPRGYLLGMRAAVLDRFGEGMSDTAREGLEAALEFLPRFVEVSRRGP
ncbi:MAG: hydrogenase maturation protease, partial [Thermodesulfobacteriota bacterium]